MSKLNLDLPILLIDTSYWLYYRFFSLRNWYYRAYPEKYNNYANDKNSFNADYNWFEDEVFMTKYKKLFIENIKKICKKFKTKMENVVFCIDCPHNDIWRKTYITKLNEKITNNKLINDKLINDKLINDKLSNENDESNKSETSDEIEEIKEIIEIQELIQEYKGTRLESHKKNKFNSFNIFHYMKNTFLPILKDNNNNNVKILSCSKCEADDIIGHLSLYIQHLHTENSSTIYILANDNDYLQVCNKNIKLINGIGNIISGLKGGHNLGDNYLLSKILLGDKSDNIKCCLVNIGYICSGIPNTNFKNVTKSCIDKIFNSPELFNVFFKLLINIRKGSSDSTDDSTDNVTNTTKIIDINKFKHNCIMMDFHMIPLELKQNLYTLFTQII